MFTVSMHLLYVLNCSQFFNTLDTDFFPDDSPDNGDEEELESGDGARKHKVKQVKRLYPFIFSLSLSLSRDLSLDMYICSLHCLSLCTTLRLVSGTLAVTMIRFKSLVSNSMNKICLLVSTVEKSFSSNSTTNQPMLWSNSTGSQY